MGTHSEVRGSGQVQKEKWCTAVYCRPELRFNAARLNLTSGRHSGVAASTGTRQTGHALGPVGPPKAMEAGRGAGHGIGVDGASRGTRSGDEGARGLRIRRRLLRRGGTDVRPGGPERGLGVTAPTPKRRREGPRAVWPGHGQRQRRLLPDSYSVQNLR